MLLSRLPALVGRSLVATVIGTAVICASVFATLKLTERACDATCTSLLQKRTAFEDQAVAQLHRCERDLQSPCAPTDAWIAYDGARRINERLVAYRRAHRDEGAAIAELAQRKITIKPAR